MIVKDIITRVTFGLILSITFTISTDTNATEPIFKDHTIISSQAHAIEDTQQEQSMSLELLVTFSIVQEAGNLTGNFATVHDMVRAARTLQKEKKADFDFYPMATELMKPQDHPLLHIGLSVSNLIKLMPLTDMGLHRWDYAKIKLNKKNYEIASNFLNLVDRVNSKG